jgi:hypothetical protein
MRLRAWFVVAGVVAGLCVACIGCPGDPDPVKHDSGVCVAYDFGLDEVTEAGSDVDADALDAGHEAEADSEADTEDTAPETEPDVGPETAADADADAEPDVADVVDAADVSDAAADAGAETDPDALADAEADVDDADAIADLVPKVCRSDVEGFIFITCSLTSCHGRFPDGQSGLYIGPSGDWTQNVVNVKSKERPDMVRVKPGDLKNSWLAHKLVGDQCLFGTKCVDGDCGDQMPGTGQPLEPTDLNTFLEWIRQGADTTTDCSGGTK